MSQANAVAAPDKQKKNLTSTDIQAYLLQARAFIALFLFVRYRLQEITFLYS